VVAIVRAVALLMILNPVGYKILIEVLQSREKVRPNCRNWLCVSRASRGSESKVTWKQYGYGISTASTRAGFLKEGKSVFSNLGFLALSSTLVLVESFRSVCGVAAVLVGDPYLHWGCLYRSKVIAAGLRLICYFSVK